MNSSVTFQTILERENENLKLHVSICCELGKPEPEVGHPGEFVLRWAILDDLEPIDTDYPEDIEIYEKNKKNLKKGENIELTDYEMENVAEEAEDTLESSRIYVDDYDL